MQDERQVNHKKEEEERSSLSFPTGYEDETSEMNGREEEKKYIQAGQTYNIRGYMSMDQRRGGEGTRNSRERHEDQDERHRNGKG